MPKICHCIIYLLLFELDLCNTSESWSMATVPRPGPPSKGGRSRRTLTGVHALANTGTFFFNSHSIGWGIWFATAQRAPSTGPSAHLRLHGTRVVPRASEPPDRSLRHPGSVVRYLRGHAPMTAPYHATHGAAAQGRRYGLATRRRTHGRGAPLHDVARPEQPVLL